MPNTISYPALSSVLPQERLSIYEKIFRTSTPTELHGAYIWSVKVAASILPLIGSLEVALRNSIHQNASKKIAPDWYNKLATRTRKTYRYKERDERNIAWHQKELCRVKKKLSGRTPPKGLKIHDLIVAKMDFGFWDNLLRECFSMNGNSLALWPQCTPLVFPHLPKGHTNATIQKEITSIRELRNNIAHHSPAWKGKSVTDQGSAITYVNEQIDQVMKIIGWLSQEKVNWLEIHMLQAEARRIASQKYLLLCQRKEVDSFSQPFSRYQPNFQRYLKSIAANEFDVVNAGQDGLFMLTKVTS